MENSNKQEKEFRSKAQKLRSDYDMALKEGDKERAAQIRQEAYQEARSQRHERAEMHSPFRVKAHPQSQPLIRNDFGGLGFGGYGSSAGFRRAPQSNQKQKSKQRRFRIFGAI